MGKERRTLRAGVFQGESSSSVRVSATVAHLVVSRALPEAVSLSTSASAADASEAARCTPKSVRMR